MTTHSDITASALLAGQYTEICTSSFANTLIQQYGLGLLASGDDSHISPTLQLGDSQQDLSQSLLVALAAFNAFLQTNVTGPVLQDVHRTERVFSKASREPHGQSLGALRQACFRSLETDGISPYAYAHNIELFGLARAILLSVPAAARNIKIQTQQENGAEGYVLPSVQWLLLRVHVWHYKLLTQPSLGPGAAFSRSSQWTDLPTLQELIKKELAATEEDVLRADGGRWTKHDAVHFLLEKVNTLIMLGQDTAAREVLKQAADRNGFVYALSGALGKRTKFQEKNISQLVVLAKSGVSDGAETTATDAQARPEVLSLNDDTLLEKLEFSKSDTEDKVQTESVPSVLANMSPDEQPQLSPVDQIILLTEATIKDAFSPTDSLTSEEILPFAVRVIDDKSTNWQIYTQALLVRSRIEIHRSRTMERGVFQMQALVDQVLVDTAKAPTTEAESEKPETDDTNVPVIQLTGPDETAQSLSAPKPTSFFPAAPESETASAPVRLQYLHVLNSPPRWHLESELAFAWAGVGSMTSALEIFQRLRLWAEVALCYAGRAAAEEEAGRGSGGEEKARTILRWRLFQGEAGTDGQMPPNPDDDTYLDVSSFTSANFQGPAREPPPANAPRLLCILGDIEDEPTLYQKAWDVSKHRFARAQMSLGEYHLKRKDWIQARDSYNKAVAANRHNPEMWTRLGDIQLRLGNFADAADAYRRSIALTGDAVGSDDPRTWSNLGSSLYSLYVEKVQELKKEGEQPTTSTEMAPVEEDEEESTQESVAKQAPSKLLAQALTAYKRGASLSQGNWQIWDNVITLGMRLRPIAVSDIVFALHNIIRIRNTENVLDLSVLRLLLNEVLLSHEKVSDVSSSTSIYQPPRGTPQKAVCDLLETQIVPLITHRSELWELITRERVWRRDFAGAVDASERAWRAAVGAAGGGLLPSSGAAGGDDKSNWLENKEAWQAVVDRTDDLVSMLENYGELVPEIGAKWKGKARSAIRSVMGKAKESWEDSAEWERLLGLLEGLR